MTNRERAIDALRIAHEVACSDYSNLVNAVERAIDAAVTEAVAAEREALIAVCKKRADIADRAIKESGRAYSIVYGWQCRHSEVVDIIAGVKARACGAK